MTSACVARNVSSELKTFTKKAGVRSAKVSRSSTAKSRSVDRRAATRSGAVGEASDDGGGTGATSVFILEPAPVVLPTGQSLCQLPGPTRMRCESDRREHRSEERRVGKECRCRWSPYH